MKIEYGCCCFINSLNFGYSPYLSCNGTAKRGWGLGIGGSSSGGMGGFLSGRAAANLLTRTTGAIAAAFMATSLILAILADQGRSSKRSILDEKPKETTNQPQVPSLPKLPPLPKGEGR